MCGRFLQSSSFVLKRRMNCIEANIGCMHNTLERIGLLKVTRNARVPTPNKMSPWMRHRGLSYVLRSNSMMIIHYKFERNGR
jgi:hypothetical protein